MIFLVSNRIVGVVTLTGGYIFDIILIIREYASFVCILFVEYNCVYTPLFTICITALMHLSNPLTEQTFCHKSMRRKSVSYKLI